MQLNLPDYTFTLKKEQGKPYIFDEVRKKYLVLTPEEWVRQNYIKFLIAERGFPSSLFQIETGLYVNKTLKRTDVVICNSTGEPMVIVECKAPSVKITQDVFDQIARYNITLKTSFLVVTNGLSHFYCKIDLDKKNYSFLKDIPHWDAIKKGEF